ncbi:MAG TPA: tetratricopeptide repeat protein, partial [Tepidisphaeraceae bacterium]|nr:tetratricopeptide repeat protein [Tepidisphaeraceae bacterium]
MATSPLVRKIDAENAVAAGNIEVHGDFNVGAAKSREKTNGHPPHNLPERNPKFVGRRRELDEIHERLCAAASLGVTQQTAAHGLGGVGKTSIAIEYAWSHLDDYPGGIFVINCNSNLLHPALAALAPYLEIEDAETAQKTALLVKSHLQSGPPSLLILDNVRDDVQWASQEFTSHLPVSPCRRLITTRHPHLPGMNMYPIERLSVAEGIELLGAHRPDAKESNNKEIVTAIVNWFDGLAVGLTVVGVYMSIHSDITWVDYAEALSAKGLGTLRETERSMAALPDYNRRVDSVFDDLLRSLPPEQRCALDYAAILPEDTVVGSWLSSLLEADSTLQLPTLPGHPHPADAVISSVQHRQLLRSAAEGVQVLTLHRILRRRVNEILETTPDRHAALLDNLCDVAKVRGQASRAALTDKSIRWELRPLLALVQSLRGSGRLNAAASLANWLCPTLRGLGRFIEARERVRHFASSEVLAAINPAEAATTLSNFAVNLRDLGDLPGARQRMEQAIQIELQHLEADHPRLAASYSNLAVILQDLGDLPGARQRMEQAIQIELQHFAPDHPTLEASYSNLALILKALGDLQGAR